MSVPVLPFQKFRRVKIGFTTHYEFYIPAELNPDPFSFHVDTDRKVIQYSSKDRQHMETAPWLGPNELIDEFPNGDGRKHSGETERDHFLAR